MTAGKKREDHACEQTYIVRKKRVVIAEDHTILREGLRFLLTEERYEVVAEASDGLEAIQLVETHGPDLILLDFSMPRMNGISVIRELKSRFPKTKVLALTIHDSEEYIFEAFHSGIDGYCLKDASRNELMLAIRNVLMGNAYFSPGVTQKIIGGYLDGKDCIKSTTPLDMLTTREREVLKLIGEGYTNKEIGDYLCISAVTVGKHRANLMKKLDLHNTPALTALAIKNGLVTR